MSRGESQFVSELITPVAGTFDAGAMSRGEPGLPTRFTWRGTPYSVADVLTVWTTSSPEAGSGEMYLRRHWWELRTTSGHVMKLYCERQAKTRRNPKARWYLYTIGQSK